MRNEQIPVTLNTANVLLLKIKKLEKTIAFLDRKAAKHGQEIKAVRALLGEKAIDDAKHDAWIVHRSYRLVMSRILVASSLDWAIRNDADNRLGVTTEEAPLILAAIIMAFDLHDDWWASNSERPMSELVNIFRDISNNGLPDEVPVTGGPWCKTAAELDFPYEK